MITAILWVLLQSPAVTHAEPAFGGAFVPERWNWLVVTVESDAPWVLDLPIGVRDGSRDLYRIAWPAAGAAGRSQVPVPVFLGADPNGWEITAGEARVTVRWEAVRRESLVWGLREGGTELEHVGGLRVRWTPPEWLPSDAVLLESVGVIVGPEDAPVPNAWLTSGGVLARSPDAPAEPGIEIRSNAAGWRQRIPDEGMHPSYVRFALATIGSLVALVISLIPFATMRGWGRGALLSALVLAAGIASGTAWVTRPRDPVTCRTILVGTSAGTGWAVHRILAPGARAFTTIGAARPIGPPGRATEQIEFRADGTVAWSGAGNWMITLPVGEGVAPGGEPAPAYRSLMTGPPGIVCLTSPLAPRRWLEAGEDWEFMPVEAVTVARE